MLESHKKSNKGSNKVLGDVFEAYVAAVILSNPEDGFSAAEQWVAQLWAPKLVAAMENDQTALATANGNSDPLQTYDPDAKAKLQSRIMVSSKVKLQYEEYRETEELKGDHLGQNKWFIALYLTGYEHERKLLGKGTGKNKVEGGNRAAMEAMYGPEKTFIDEFEARVKADKEEYKRQKEASEAAKVKQESGAADKHAIKHEEKADKS